MEWSMEAEEQKIPAALRQLITFTYWLNMKYLFIRQGGR